MTANPTRDQLSLFLSGTDGERLDALRRQLDPIQAALIPAHVTLCREDELAGGIGVGDLTEGLHDAAPVTLRFGPPERFGDHGILLPCIAGQDGFDALRRRVLRRSDVRHQAAHITLAHPRNPKSSGNQLPLGDLVTGCVLTLNDLRWIRQTGRQPWQTLARATLAPTPPARRPKTY
jgi:hypothetical protein